MKRRPSPAPRPRATPAAGLPANALPRLLAPVLFAAAILVSGLLDRPEPVIALPAGEMPEPAATQVAAALARAVAPGSPGHDLGGARGTVTVLEFSDFGCRYSERFAVTAYPEIAAAYVRTGAVRWKYVPFALGMFPNGARAAAAAECAAEQSAAGFRRLHERLFAAPSEWRNLGDPARVFERYAREARLDAGRFGACLAARPPAERIRAANALADELGVRSTPTFFINGRRVEGALSAAEFRTLLEQALRDAGPRPFLAPAGE